jgi:serine/threonine-protein kinase
LAPHLGGSGAPVVAPGVADPEGYRAYLQGRHFANRRTEADLKRAIASFESALAREPGFALAAAGLADAWFMLGVYGALAPSEAMPQAKLAAARAVASGRESAEALAIQGSVRAVYDWDWTGAETDLRRALALSPGNPAVLHRYAVNCLLPRGRFAEARGSLHYALERDPLSLVIAASIGLLNYLEGRPTEAVAACRAVLELNPGFGLASYFLGLALLQSEAPADAVPALEAAVTATARSAETVAALGSAYAAAGRPGDAERCLTELKTTAQTRYVSPALPAQIVLGLGRPEEALTWLEQALEKRAAEMIWLAVRPTWTPLRRDPRFQVLLRQVGLA